MTIKELTNIMDQGLSLKLISQAYTEIASAKLKKIRTMVEKNRYYLENLSGVYLVVKQISSHRGLLKPAKINKTISILITSNYHFYGNVNSNLIRYFVSNMTSHPTDQIIIGKTALEWLRANHYNLPFQEFDLKTDLPDDTELNKLVSIIKDYEQIIVYFSKLKTVMVQEPTFEDITQNAYLRNNDLPKSKKKEDQTFIFEPELAKILDFFTSQVTSLLLQQTFLESELSRTASRLISMDQAQSNADKFISDQKRLIAQAKRSIVNSRLLETYTAISALRDEDKEN